MEKMTESWLVYDPSQLAVVGLKHGARAEERARVLASALKSAGRAVELFQRVEE